MIQPASHPRFNGLHLMICSTAAPVFAVGLLSGLSEASFFFGQLYQTLFSSNTKCVSPLSLDVVRCWTSIAGHLTAQWTVSGGHECSIWRWARHGETIWRTVGHEAILAVSLTWISMPAVSWTLRANLTVSRT